MDNRGYATPTNRLAESPATMPISMDSVSATVGMTIDRLGELESLVDRIGETVFGPVPTPPSGAEKRPEHRGLTQATMEVRSRVIACQEKLIAILNTIG